MQRLIISASVARLSVYHRILTTLETDNASYICSSVLGEKSGFSAAQVRKDLAAFGSFGCPGKGYGVSKLRQEIGCILGRQKKWNVALVGVGNLGKALLSYAGFRIQGFDIIAAFDIDVKKIGKRCGGLIIKSITELLPVTKNKKIEIGIIAVPEDAAQKITDLLIKAQIRAILNFAPTRLNVSKNTKLHSIDLSVELDKLSHMLTTC